MLIYKAVYHLTRPLKFALVVSVKNVILSTNKRVILWLYTNSKLRLKIMKIFFG